MVHDQMLCIVTPPRAHDADALRRILQESAAALDAVFDAVGSVHFASVVLLPPRAIDDDKTAAGSSLMLELAIDDDIDHAVLMDDIATHGLELLWPLYQGHWEDAGRPADRRAWLAGLLARHADGAAGGFVGARDRTREQIIQESKLFRDLREMLRARPVNPAEDTQAVASRVIENAWNMPDTQWAEKPAPRSFWRNPKLTPPKRALLTISLIAPPLGFLALLLLLGSLLGIAGAISLGAPAWVLGPEITLGKQIFGNSQAWSGTAVSLVAVPILVLVISALMGSAGLLSPKLALMLLIAPAVLGMVPMAVLLVGLQQTWLPDLWELFCALLRLAGVGFLALAWLGAVVMGGGLLFGAALLLSPRHLGGKALVPVFVLLLALGACVVHCVFALAVADASGDGLLAALKARGLVGGWLPAIDALALLTLVFAALTVWLLAQLRFVTRSTDSWFRKRDRPRPADVERGQQVHKSVMAADSALVGKVGHMVSLTEIRRPRFIHAAMLKMWLRLITRIGHTGFTEGVLGHAQGIKFGHWHLIDGNRRMLFCSNFDGDFGSYLDDFIIGASHGINLFWRWTELRPRPAAGPGQPAVDEARGFPPTRLGVFRGCKYEQWFKTFARDSMLPHLYRYEAYTDSSQDIARATRLRDALFAARCRNGDDQIMRALES